MSIDAPEIDTSMTLRSTTAPPSSSMRTGLGGKAMRSSPAAALIGGGQLVAVEQPGDLSCQFLATAVGRRKVGRKATRHSTDDFTFEAAKFVETQDYKLTDFR